MKPESSSTSECGEWCGRGGGALRKRELLRYCIIIILKVTASDMDENTRKIHKES